MPTARTGHRRLKALLDVHRAQPVAAGAQAVLTVGKPLQIPEVGKNARGLAGGSGLREREAAFEVAQPWRAEQPLRLERFERAVPCPGRDKGYRRRAGLTGKVDRSQQPLVVIVVRHERGRHEQEHAKRHAKRLETAGGENKVAGRHLLVQPLERLGMCRFEPDRDFECRDDISRLMAMQPVEKAASALADQRRM